MNPAIQSAPPRFRADIFTTLMQLWQTGHADQHNYEELLQANPALRSTLGQSPCIIWVMDLRQGQFIFVSDNVERILGYAAELFRKRGTGFLNEQIHPDDLPRVNTLREIRNEWLGSLLPLERDSFKFNCDYRFRRANGTYAWLFEQNTILPTKPRSHVTHLLGVVSDIPPRQKNQTPVAWAFPAEPITHQKPTADRLPVQLSKRECEIVQLLAEGYTSKTIAGRLELSLHTVNTHRRNIIERTCAKTTGGLIQYAMSNGLI